LLLYEIKRSLLKIQRPMIGEPLAAAELQTW
jgi:hypothetical protein